MSPDALFSDITSTPDGGGNISFDSRDESDAPIDEVFGAATLPDVSGITGAQIDEKQVVVTLHVNQQDGADSNDGKTPQTALATITQGWQKAIPFLESGQGVKILIYPGVYRESLGYLQFNTDKSKTTLLIFEGTEPGKVIVSGSDVYTPASWKDIGDGIYEHSWPYDFGNACAPTTGHMPELLGHRREMVFINGEMLKPVILEDYTIDAANSTYSYIKFSNPKTVLKQGTFGVAEREENGNRIFIKPREGTNWPMALIEVAVRKTFATFTPRSHTIFRKLVFQHFANGHQPWNYNQESPIYFPAWVQEPFENTLFEDCIFRWNNWSGLSLSKMNKLTIRRCTMIYNGGSGLHSNGCETCGNWLFEDNETSFNNWRGYWGGQTGWYIGGVKHASFSGQILRRHKAIGNLSSGIWYDIHAKNVLIEDLQSMFNNGIGLFLEISYGPFLVDRTLLVYNKDMGFQYYTVGECTVRNTIIAGSGFQPADTPTVRFYWYPRPGNSHWEQDAFEPGHVSMLSNVFLGIGADPLLWQFSDNTNYPAFIKGYEGLNNIWYRNNGKDENAFLYGPWGKTAGDFAEWEKFIGDREKNPRWLDPGFVDANSLDFRITSSSPIYSRKAFLKAIRIPDELLKQTEDFFNWAGFKFPLPSRK